MMRWNALPKKPAHADLYGDPLPAGAVMRLGSVQLRHYAALLAFSPDGKTLVSAGQADASIRIWENATGRLLRQIRLAATKIRVREIALAADGKTLVAVVDETVHVWDASTGKELRHFRAPSGLSGLTLSRDGKFLAGSISNLWADDLQLWDVRAGKGLRLLRSGGRVKEMALSPDGRVLGIVCAGEPLLLWDTATGKELRKISGPLRELAFSPDGKCVAANSEGGVVRIWNVADGGERGTFPKLSPQEVRSLAFSPDGNILAVGSDKELVIWSVSARKQLHRIPTLCSALAFAPDGKSVASASNEAIHLWNVATGAESIRRPGHDAYVRFLEFSPDGRSVASIAAYEADIFLWDAVSGERRRVFPGHDQPATVCAFSRDGRLLVTGGADGMVRLWETSTGKERQMFSLGAVGADWEKWYVSSLALSSNGDRLCAVASEVDGGWKEGRRWIVLWDVATGENLVRRMDQRDTRPVSLSSDVRRVARLDGKHVVVEDTLTGREIGRTRLPGVFDGRFTTSSPGGQFVAVADNGSRSHRFVLMDLVLGEPSLSADQQEGEIEDVFVSPEGRMLATVLGNTIRVWDASAGKEMLRRRFREDVTWPDYFFTNLAFSPGGDRLAAGLKDGTTLIWDLAPETRRAGVHGQGLERLWADLRGDSGAAHRGIWRLESDPAKSVPFLTDRLRPAPSIDPKHVEHLLAGLDSARFSERQAAANQLTDLGEGVVPALREALGGTPPLELRKRLEMICDEVRTNDLRALRAIRALEHIGTPAARQVLDTLVRGDRAASSTRHAREALQRLVERGPSGAPRNGGGSTR
jgi:WD40 repeat protein